MNAACIRLDRVSLDFPVFHTGGRSLKKLLLSAGGRLHRTGRDSLRVAALRGISLAIAPGERIGLLGGNGAGKTSLLRVLGGIYEPSHGTVITQGRRHALLHPEQGMHPDLTGRENIRLGGLYHGLSGTALRGLEDDVAAFAALGEFLDLPLRVYSAGMAVRLGFSLATAIRPNILLMDEWFLAGDAAFMQRAYTRLADLVRGVDILVLATHQDQVLRDWCTRVIWLDQGRVRADGPPGDVIDAYHRCPAAPPMTAQPALG